MLVQNQRRTRNWTEESDCRRWKSLHDFKSLVLSIDWCALFALRLFKHSSFGFSTVLLKSMKQSKYVILETHPPQDVSFISFVKKSICESSLTYVRMLACGKFRVFKASWIFSQNVNLRFLLFHSSLLFSFPSSKLLIPIKYEWSNKSSGKSKKVPLLFNY